MWKREITVNGNVWEIELNKFIGKGIDALAYTSDDYPNLVLIIFSKKRGYKYDWYKHIDLIYGESEWDGNYVLILPLMEHITPPRWYTTMGYMIHRKNMVNASYIIDQYLDGMYDDLDPDEDDVNIHKWMKIFRRFLDIHPKYEQPPHCFDLNNTNIMSRNGEYIITDPLFGP